MREEVRHMQRVTPTGRTILAIVAAVTASAIAAATFAGPAQTAQIRSAHICPPAC
jgi:hypothetical protein